MFSLVRPHAHRQRSILAAMVAIRAALLVALSGQCEGASSSTALNANPIRKVVSMLQMMQNKVTAEGKKEEVLSRSSCAVARLASGI